MQSEKYKTEAELKFTEEFLTNAIKLTTVAVGELWDFCCFSFCFVCGFGFCLLVCWWDSVVVAFGDFLTKNAYCTTKQFYMLQRQCTLVLIFHLC